MNLCKTCKHFSPGDTPEGKSDLPLGSCGRWRYGYHVALKDIKPNEVVVENDEGWGAIVGAEFGCVLHEASE